MSVRQYNELDPVRFTDDWANNADLNHEYQDEIVARTWLRDPVEPTTNSLDLDRASSDIATSPDESIDPVYDSYEPLTDYAHEREAEQQTRDRQRWYATTTEDFA